MRLVDDLLPLPFASFPVYLEAFGFEPAHCQLLLRELKVSEKEAKVNARGEAQSILIMPGLEGND